MCVCARGILSVVNSSSVFASLDFHNVPIANVSDQVKNTDVRETTKVKQF